MCAKLATLSTTNDDSQTKIMYWHLLKVLCDINLLSSQTVEQVVLKHTSLLHLGNNSVVFQTTRAASVSRITDFVCALAFLYISADGKLIAMGSFLSFSLFTY